MCTGVATRLRKAEPGAVECRPVDSTVLAAARHTATDTHEPAVLLASSYDENGRSSEVVQVALLANKAV